MDDDYFRRAVSTRIEAGDHPSALEIQKKVVQSSARPESRGFTLSWLDSLTEIDLYSASGVYLGKTYSQRVKRDRFHRVVERTTLGLYYDEFGCRLPESDMVGIFPLDDFPPDNSDCLAPFLQLMKYAMSGSYKVFGNNVFEYWVNTNDASQPGQLPAETFWVQAFYQSTMFLVGTHAKSGLSDGSSSK